ncbi:FKBP-type peptidyl-prolyl cis-trans isomerase [Naviculisporaceae sp. PSN 640]
MGVVKTTIAEGHGNRPKPGDVVEIQYTGWLKDASKPGGKGAKFDSSDDHGGDFKVRIGVGVVIQGWDEGVLEMREGEKATLDITSDYAYGERGFRGHIPPKADLIFDVYLKKIGGQM